ncbi:iron-sulfur cluster assembly scaffold protein [Candidatus Dependentiae bacterium]|nr:iron-sulfur cluster assembly scaffold protein [Candidatus Dependentiae bacterium]
MWEYSEKVKEHFLNPHNVGKLDDANVVVEVGSAACGDALKLFLKIENDTIADVKFQTYGCGSAIASSSVLTDLIKGKNLDEVKKISNQDIVDLLGGLPPAKIHCSVMAQEAIEKALKIYYKEDLDEKLAPGEIVVCHCFKITNFKIEKAVREHNLKTVEEVINYTKAGGACGKCKPDILEIINKAYRIEGEKKMTNLEKIEKLKSVIENEIRPGLQNDGGDIELIDFADNVASVKLKGSCSGCPMATMTIKSFVEETLKSRVDEKIQVKEVR